MRTMFLAALVAATVGLTTATPASAYWQCMGGYVACGSGSAKSTTSYTKSKKTSYKASKKTYKAASKPSYKKKSYKTASHGGDGYAKPKKVRKAKSGGSYSGGSSSGIASYYWQPQRVASGGWFNPNAMTAAHKTLPFGTKVRVTNVRNGRSVVVRINDRGPYIKGRVIDLSRAAAGSIGMINSGVAPVHIAILGR